LGLEHPLVSSSLKNLARLYYFQTRYELSEPLFKRALTIRQKTYGKEHERYADIEEQYAKLLRKTGRVLLAQELDNHVQRVRGKAR
ncbi:MAG TPA: tetratricopeptide repeat protein, partial [Candidatus Obscuribacter sp.]|nr:tetratricopeptide repeat protein [Candidatus Obscuribacter sp.]